MKRVIIFNFVMFLLLPCFAQHYEWQLPINLGDMRGSVRKALGQPNDTAEVYKDMEGLPGESESPQFLDEHFYSSGIEVRFQNDSIEFNRNRAIQITIFPTYSHPSYYAGKWKKYSGAFVNGVTMADTYETAVQKLGFPMKIEEDEVKKSKENLDTPVVFPARKRCYWRDDHCTIEIHFLNQAESLDEKNIIAKRGSIREVRVYE